MNWYILSQQKIPLTKCKGSRVKVPYGGWRLRRVTTLVPKRQPP